MEFRVLGHLEVERAGEPLRLGSFRQRTLLALLLIHANEVVSSDRIIDELWGDETALDHHNALWVHVSNLRSALEPDRGPRSEGTVVLTRSPGYVLEVAPEQLDVWRFERLLHEGRTLLDDDPAAAAIATAEALALWRGRPYEDFAYESFAQTEIVRLEELRLEAVELRIEADLRRGLASELVGELEALVRQHPLRERMAALLMLALYRAGRQGDALRAYTRLREALADELGLDPSPHVQRLEAQILAQDDTLHTDQAVTGRGDRLAVRGYELREAIGKGRFGTTYRAFQPVVGREVAITTARVELANDPSFIRRFEAEAELVARLEHPHIAPLYDYWREPDAAFMVSRYFRRGTLAATTTQEPLPASVVEQLASDVGSALAHAHRHGVIHGDIDPTNIVLDEEYRGYLTNFALGIDNRGGDGASPTHDSAFASPEQRAGAPSTCESDVYSWGALLACLLSQRGPGDLQAALAELPRPLATVLRHATATDPAARPPDAAAFVDAYRAVTGVHVVPAARSVQENPYKGLRAFEEADAPDFFGRDRQVERLLTRLGDVGTRGRFVAVVGPSGSGKSSIAKAGVVPALRAGALPGSADWFIVFITPGAHPFEALEAALRTIAVRPPHDLLERLMADASGLAWAVRRVLPDSSSQLLLVIDQFEELFAHASETTATAFLDALEVAIVDPASRLRVVMTIRADFYDRPLQHRGIGELVRRGTEVITPMSAQELERAIVGPAERVGVHFAPGLVAEIVADVAARPGALPLLQYALTELLERRHGTVVDLESFEEIGRVSGGLVRRAEALYSEFGPETRVVTRQALLRMVTIGEAGDIARRRVRREELVELNGPCVHTVLDTFGRHRLLSFDRDPVTRAPAVEIAHEALLSEWGRLRTWIDDAREDLRQHRRLANDAFEWQLAGRDADLLLRGGRLDQVTVWADSTDLVLAPLEREFVEASVSHRDRQLAVEEERLAGEDRLRRISRRRYRLLLAGAVVIALVAALAGYALTQRNEANRLASQLATTAEARRLASASISAESDSSEVAMLLALQSLDLSARAGVPALPEAVDALNWAIQQARIPYPVRDGPVEVHAGPRGATGLYRLPLRDVVGLGRSYVTRTFRPADCDRYGLDPCPTSGAGLASPASAGLREVPHEPVGPADPVGQPILAGTHVSIVGAVDPNRGLVDEINWFFERTGVQITYRSNADEVSRVLSGSALSDADVVLVPEPSAVRAAARSGSAIDLSTYLDVSELRRAFGDYVVNAMTVGSGHYGIPADVRLKGLVWYPEQAFRQAGYEVPRSWDDLVRLTDRMVAEGRTPWCVDLGDKPADATVGTDWIEELVLRLGGVDAYDRWSHHEVGFSDAVVREAFERFEGIAAGAAGGGGTTLSHLTQADGVDAMLAQPPRCWLQAGSSDLAATLPPNAAAGRDVGFFVLPSVSGTSDPSLVGTSDIAVAQTDRPEVREFMRWLLDPQWGSSWTLHSDSMFLPASLTFDPAHCRTRENAEALNADRVALCRNVHEAISGGSWRFDAVDLMPPAVGGISAAGRPGAFPAGVIDYIDDGPASLDLILASIDAAWPP